MPIAFGLWSVSVGNGSTTVTPVADVRITHAALADSMTSSLSAPHRTFVKLRYKDEGNEEREVVLCSITPEKNENVTLDLILSRGQEYSFHCTSHNPVDLVGNYIDQYDGAFDEESSDEGSLDLEEVSDDLKDEMNDLDDMESDASRFEEVEEDEPPKAAKRPRESEGGEPGKKLSNAEKKKLKKFKSESGQAVPAPANAAASASKVNAQQGKKGPPPADVGKKATAGKEHSEKKGKPKDGNHSSTAVTKGLTGGIEVKDSKTGTGPQAKSGDTVSMRYIGKLQNGTVFDQNTKGKPFTFHLGIGEVIKGWDVGIVGMQVGGERVLTIPPSMGYGRKAQKGIPSNSTLTFECKLLEIK